MKKRLTTILTIIVVPLLYALFMRVFFGADTWGKLFDVMSLTFLVCLPTTVGALVVYFSSEENAGKTWYKVMAPWMPIIFFMIITLVTGYEGWACWIMILPLFMIAASIGGYIGAWLKFRKKNRKTYVSVLLLLPFVAGPLESMIGSIPGTYKAYTYIDIKAPAAVIWQNVTRVKTIPPNQDKGWLTRFLGFPRPVRAELDYEGIGGSREAVFTDGLVFHETVTEYQHQKKMVFSIKAYPHEIPAATMDEHVVIGGDYFDVLDGTYELEQLNDSVCRLHLYSHFKTTTSFNFYASWWAGRIMKDIQNNILQIEKERSEAQQHDSIPQPYGRTNDFEHVFTARETQTLDSIISAFDKETGIEIAIVTLDSTYVGSQDFEALSLKIARDWEPGKKGEGNGILIALCMGKRKIWIQNANGIVKKMSDKETGDIIQNYFIPAYRKQEYFNGTRQGLLAIIDHLRTSIHKPPVYIKFR